MCAIPLSVGGLAAVKPNPKPNDLPDAVAAALLEDTDTAVNDGVEMIDLLPVLASEPKPKLKPVEAEPKPVKPLNAPVCTAYATTYHCCRDRKSINHKRIYYTLSHHPAE